MVQKEITELSLTVHHMTNHCKNYISEHPPSQTNENFKYYYESVLVFRLYFDLQIIAILLRPFCIYFTLYFYLQVEKNVVKKILLVF